MSSLIRQNGQLRPGPGYRWVTPEPGDLRVRWVPGTHHPTASHVVAGANETYWNPSPGYRWVSPDTAHDLSVVWSPNKPHATLPDIVASDQEGWWKPRPGYAFKARADDLSVVWLPGLENREHPHVVAAPTEGMWRLAYGFAWTAPQDYRNLDVLWRPGTIHPGHPYTVAAESVNTWRPAPGHVWSKAGFPATEWDDDHQFLIARLIALSARLNEKEFQDACREGAIAAGAGAAAGALAGGGVQGGIIWGVAGCVASKDCRNCVTEIEQRCEDAIRGTASPARDNNPPPAHPVDPWKDWSIPDKPNINDAPAGGLDKAGTIA